MLLSSKGLILSAIIAGVASPSAAFADISERFEFSGFGRVVGGYMDASGAEYEGYSNTVSFSQQSLFALQSDITINDKLSLSGQLLAHSSEKRDSGIEWLYVNYEPTQNWRFKLGKLRTPFFRYSDVVDVGFAYPWISPPQQVYSGFLFSNYEGATGTYRVNVNTANLEFEIYGGKYNGEFTRIDDPVDLKVNDIRGIILSVNSGNLALRVSASTSSDFDVDIPEFRQFSLALQSAGFTENAESLSFDGEVEAYQANINYDTLNYFLAAEWVKISSGLLVIPELNSYYFSAGYNFYPFQAHVTYSVSDNSYATLVNSVPKGVSPQLDQLSNGFDLVVENLPNYTLNSLTLGLRWDFHHNTAAKAEITFLDGVAGENSFFSNITNPDFDRKATLYQIGVEWVF